MQFRIHANEDCYYCKRFAQIVYNRAEVNSVRRSVCDDCHRHVIMQRTGVAQGLDKLTLAQLRQLMQLLSDERRLPQ